jgi:hypothetical protein
MSTHRELEHHSMFYFIMRYWMGSLPSEGALTVLFALWRTAVHGTTIAKPWKVYRFVKVSDKEELFGVSLSLMISLSSKVF